MGCDIVREIRSKDFIHRFGGKVLAWEWLGVFFINPRDMINLDFAKTNSIREISLHSIYL